MAGKSNQSISSGLNERVDKIYKVVGLVRLVLVKSHFCGENNDRGQMTIQRPEGDPMFRIETINRPTRAKSVVEKGRVWSLEDEGHPMSGCKRVWTKNETGQLAPSL